MQKLRMVKLLALELLSLSPLSEVLYHQGVQLNKF
jgi:hypothetical protein